MKDTESNICQITAIKDGRLVFSETYNGYSKSDCCHIASATKSIVALLVCTSFPGYFTSQQG